MTRLVVAAAQYPSERLDSWGHYAAKVSQWIAEAAAGGARLAVFPEYAAMELASLDPATMSDLKGSLGTVSSLLPQVDALHAALARQHAMHILAGSAPCAVPGRGYVNRSRLFAPTGKVGVQDKLVMTRFERETWFVASGAPLRLFRTSLGNIGINICYDSEFPLLARAQIEAGMDLLLVPSCTDSLHGYWRVRLGAQARALEGQCYAVQAPTVGTAEWSPAVDVNRGTAAIYGPPDRGMPDDGVLSIGVADAPQWVFAELDLNHIASLRADGGVLNRRHWVEQPGATPLPAVEVVDLR